MGRVELKEARGIGGKVDGKPRVEFGYEEQRRELIKARGKLEERQE